VAGVRLSVASTPDPQAHSAWIQVPVDLCLGFGHRNHLGHLGEMIDCRGSAAIAHV